MKALKGRQDTSSRSSMVREPPVARDPEVRRSAHTASELGPSVCWAVAALLLAMLLLLLLLRARLR